MDDLEDLQASEFVTDTEDQDSLDERIDSEQRLRNQQLWASFQNAACCITKLYKDRAQPNISPWTPFQNAASNLTTLYKDCIESQRRFARIGYQVGRRKRVRELSKLLKKHKLPNNKHQNATTAADHATQIDDDSMMQHQSVQQQNNSLGSISGGGNNESSILNVNQLNLGCDDSISTNSMQSSSNHLMHSQSSHHHHHHQLQQQQLQSQHQQSTAIQPQANLQILLGNNEDDLLTFQQALTQPAIRGIKSSQNRRPCSNSPGYLNNRLVDPKSEEDKLLELNQFLSEEYHRHVGSRKRSCSTLGGTSIKRLRE